MVDIHNYKGRLERTIGNIHNSDEISEENKKIIMKFHDNCFSEGISICKTERYIYDLSRLAKTITKPLDKLTKDDLKRIVADIEKKEWSPYSKQSFKVLLKKFFKWTAGGEEYPEKIKWLKANMRSTYKKMPEELLTEDEVKKLIRFADSSRNKAFIAVLYESGCRIGEVGNLKIKDIAFDEFGARIKVTGKTGPRVVRIVNSAPYLQAWINLHPSEDPESYVWIKRDGQPLGYNTFSGALRKAAKAAGIKKPVNPHNFRHARASVLAQHITESQMKNYLGWEQSSKMAAVYVHMKDTDDAILQMNGLRKDTDKEDETLKPVVCTRCKTKNEVTNKFCKICGLPLDQNTVKEIISRETKQEKTNDIMNLLLKDEDVIRLISEKMKEIIV